MEENVKPGQDPAKIKMGKLDDEDEKQASLQGTVILGLDPDGGKVIFFRDFEIEGIGAEQLTAYLAEDGNLNKSVELGDLKENSGSFSLPIPSQTDTAPYNTVVLRNKKSKKKVATVDL